MRLSFVALLSLFPMCVYAVDGRISLLEQEQLAGQGAAAVFVYGTGSESPPATCVPEVVNIKAANGANISTTTVCEKINIASNPHRYFTVSGKCSPLAPSTMSATCGATNTTTNWMNVSMEIKPELDDTAQSGWSSIFCNNCSWQWVASSNNCNGSSSTSTGRVISHDFTGNPTGVCTSSGAFSVTDPETGKTWTSPSLTGTLRPTAPRRDFALSHVATTGANTAFYSSLNAETDGSTGSLTFHPRLDGKEPSRWGTDLNCPRCKYTRVNVSTNCSVGAGATSTSATLNTASFGSCSYGYAYTVSDPDTGWSARFPTSGYINYSIRKKPIPCVESSSKRWVASSSSCPTGYTGSISFETEQVSHTQCPGPTYTSWANTGNKRNTVENCKSTTPPPPSPPSWVAMLSTKCTQMGTNSWGDSCNALSESTFGSASASVKAVVLINGKRASDWPCAACKVVSVIDTVTCPLGDEYGSGVVVDVESGQIVAVAIAQQMGVAMCRGGVEFAVSDGHYTAVVGVELNVDVSP